MTNPVRKDGRQRSRPALRLIDTRTLRDDSAGGAVAGSPSLRDQLARRTDALAQTAS